MAKLYAVMGRHPHVDEVCQADVWRACYRDDRTGEGQVPAPGVYFSMTDAQKLVDELQTMYPDSKYIVYEFEGDVDVQPTI